ncbi:MAG TPA: hypothetical protein VM580_02490 [Labilithrix sp.]|jgi:hypothetical protein|nr:hypothetical protein [Labilithrix sp.]
MVGKALALIFATSLLLACDGESSGEKSNGASSGTSGAVGTSVGSGTVDGRGGFTVVTAKRADPEPFREKARLEVVLSSDAACGRSGCPTYEQLFLRLSSQPGGTITPGVYSFIQKPDAGAAGGLEIRLEDGSKEPDGCRAGSRPGEGGTVTLESFTETEAKGTFDIDVQDGNSTAHLTGRFDALKCP